jgi:hypothetical protein
MKKDLRVSVDYAWTDFCRQFHMELNFFLGFRAIANKCQIRDGATIH